MARDNSLTFHTGHSLHSKDIIRIPESHTLHVGPAACARRHVIKAIEKNDAQNVSHLAISEDDLATGAYEQQIVDALSDLLAMLPKQPRIILICLKCIDDLVGTDTDSLLEFVSDTFPQIRFAITRIDPIALSKTVSPSEKNKATHYQFIEPGQPQDNGITLAGSYERIPEDCELHEVLASWGIGPVRNILDCLTYQDYQDLGKSKACLCMTPMGKRAAQELHSTTGIPWCNAPLGYNPMVIASFYRSLATLLGKPAPLRLAEWEANAEAKLRTTAERASAYQFAVDSSASMQSFLLAKTLLEHGFRVTCVTTKGVTDLERPAYDWIVSNHPATQIVRTHSYKALIEGAYGLSDNLIVIGADFARMIGARRAVDIWHDEGFCAFQGVSKLCDMIQEAAR